MRDHEAARAWLSAHRDGEVGDDRAARDHLDECPRCRGWERGLGPVDSAVHALRSTPVPDVTSAATAAWGRRARAGDRPWVAGRVVLAAAGIGGLGLAALSLVTLPGGHATHDLVGFQVAFAIGFLLCSARPSRYGRALLPLTAAASVVVLLPSAAAAATSRVGLLAEAGHLPVLVGLVGLLLMADAERGRSSPPTLV